MSKIFTQNLSRYLRLSLAATGIQALISSASLTRFIQRNQNRDAPEQPLLQYLVLYGSLRQGHRDFETLRLAETLQFCGPCQLKGVLLDLGDYPGFVLDHRSDLIGRSEHARRLQILRGELYQFKGDPRPVLETLDKFERFNAPDLRRLQRWSNSGSLYVRRPVWLEQPRLKAYVYEYNGEIFQDGRVRTGKPIPSGDWSLHVNARQQPAA